ncbi:hypothetical protein DMC30DRAFT_405253 [Rhodotorula diobovata]|uniref:Cytidyltransferase-like domain-containing protein n=1 Tax=Rhodotorula diobovata TaxID=5288 RepID=A0A5C5FPE1_9BASI|nr:hypothetical protein DMC30DRAFT_405253 [Rhodotorula diobovata]
MSHDPSDRFLVLSFPSISHWVTLPRATSSSSPLSSHLDAVHHAAQQTTQSLTVVIRTPSDAPSPWRNPSAPTTSSPPLSSSPSSDPSLSPTALFLPLEQALARVYNAATSAFFASDDGPLKNVDVVVEQLRDISRVCIPQDAQVDRWEWTDAAAEGDGKGKGKADGARAPPPPPEAGASSGLPPLYPVVALGGTFDHLHAGHKILLTMACSLCSQRLVVGVSDDHLLVNKKYRHLVQSLDERLAAVTRFVALVRPAIECDAVPLQVRPSRADLARFPWLGAGLTLGGRTRRTCMARRRTTRASRRSSSRTRRAQGGTRVSLSLPHSLCPGSRS